jgi:hypothetical protein
MFGIETTFLISLIGTLLWLGGLWLMSRSLRAGLSLQLGSTLVFAVLNVLVGAYPGLVGAAVGVVLMVRTIRIDARRASRRRSANHPAQSTARAAIEAERVWSEALSRLEPRSAY